MFELTYVELDYYKKLKDRNYKEYLYDKILEVIDIMEYDLDSSISFDMDEFYKYFTDKEVLYFGDTVSIFNIGFAIKFHQLDKKVIIMLMEQSLSTFDRARLLTFACKNAPQVIEYAVQRELSSNELEQFIELIESYKEKN